MPGADGRSAEEGLGTGFLPSDSRSSGGLLLPSEENPSAPSGEKPFRSGADPNSSRRHLYRKPVHQKRALGGRTAENRWSVHQNRALGGRTAENRWSVHQNRALGGRTAENRWSVHLKRALGGRTGKKPASVHQKRAPGGRTGAGRGRKGCGWGAETKKAPRRSFFVPGAGVEPAQPLQPLVFETSASTDSAIRAMWRQVCAVNELQK